MRINKYLASCGIASRRNCEQLVLDGKVKLNGRPVVKLATEVKPGDIITVDGNKVFPSQEFIYLMLHKPKGYICSTSDEHGRKTVMELVKDYENTRLFPVGRLDYDTEGLLLLTNDGDFSLSVTHPKNNVDKTYHAKIEGEVSEDELIKIRNGIVLDGEKTKRCKAVNLGMEKGLTKIELVISEGRQRQIRRMFEAINREVVFLKRTAIGSLRLGGLQRGKCRELKAKEIEKLIKQ